jgi:hypothetical protein
MQYDELKQRVPKLEEYYEKFVRFSEMATKDVTKLKLRLDRIREEVNGLFQDISANEPRSYKENNN